ncbi:MAG: hypothetical protein LC794_17930 [Acidobacteria bacterium]|nr:hypothetical protein [Acidobacteriota bacterium]
MAIENCGGRGEPAQMMSPFSGRFTTNSVSALHAEFRLYPTTTLPFGTASMSQMIGGDGLRVLRPDF